MAVLVKATMLLLACCVYLHLAIFLDLLLSLLSKQDLCFLVGMSGRISFYSRTATIRGFVIVCGAVGFSIGKDLVSIFIVMKTMRRQKITN